MKLKYLFFLLALLKSLPGYCGGEDTVKLFYNINQRELSLINKNKLDSLNKYLTDTTALKIIGYADYLGKSALNYPLSKDRADIVKDYLLNLHRKNLLIVADGKGQVNSTIKLNPVLGEPVNRRVDIIRATPPLKPGAKTYTYTGPKRKDDSVYKRINSLPTINVGERLSFKELTFLPGRRFLRIEAFPYLEALTQTLKEHPTIKIEIQGHICCQFDNKDGIDIDTRTNNLSYNRAKYVYEYLAKNGIRADRMRYIGLGSSDPKIYPEKTVEDQNQNRRVVIVLLSK